MPSSRALDTPPGRRPAIRVGAGKPEIPCPMRSNIRDRRES